MGDRIVSDVRRVEGFGDREGNGLRDSKKDE